MYIIFPHILKMSFHMTGQAHLKPTSDGTPIIFDGHAFAEDIYDKKSRMFTETSKGLPENPGAIGILRPFQILNKISSPQFKNMFNQKNITINPLTLFPNSFGITNVGNLRLEFDRLTHKRQINKNDLVMLCYEEDGELCFLYGHASKRYTFRLNLFEEESLNKIPGYEAGAPAMKTYFKQFLV